MWEQVKRVIEYSQDLDNIKTDFLQEEWVKNKARYITYFNPNRRLSDEERAIYEMPEEITVELSDAIKKIKFEEFKNEVYSYNVGLYNFLESLSYKEFFNNKLMNDYDDTIKKGMRVLKCFKSFGDDEYFMMRASAVIQQNKIKGKLCFSVHPLDFLSSSESTYNWRSCHALDGEYAAGNLSYMIDKSTIMCYLKGADDVKLPRFPDDVRWNSKKWRVLLHFTDTPDNDFVFAGRQYPFSSDELMEKVKEGLEKVFDVEYKPWDNSVVDSAFGQRLIEPYYLVREKYLLGQSDLIQEDDLALNYNDLLRSSVYRNPFYTTTSFLNPNIIKVGRVHAGARCKCLRCEKKYIEHSDDFLCPQCETEYGNKNNENYGFCIKCGKHVGFGINGKQDNWNGDWYCDDCAEDGQEC